MGEGEVLTTQGIQIAVLGPIGIDGDRSGEPFGPRLRRVLARLVVGDGLTVDELALIEAV